MTGYRRVLAVPGMAPLLGVSLLARIAVTAAVMALTMVVVVGLHRGYAAAGVVAAALTAGMALGGPLVGRAIDRRGVRPVLLVTTAVQGVFWPAAPLLPYDILVGCSVLAGLLMVPAPSVTRQAIAAMTVPEQRRPAFALEAVQGELSYIVGPALVIVGAAQLSPGLVAGLVGATIAAGGFGLAGLNPSVRPPEQPVTAERPAHWLGAGFLAVLLMALGATMLLSGVDLAIVATLRAAGQTSWAAGVVVVFGVASVVGGLLYGALPRSLPTWLLLALLALVTIPAGLARTWPGLGVAIVGVGLLTAPTLSAIADTVSRLVPAAVRGEATGLQSSAQSGGFALGSPLTGLAIDGTGPAGGFAAAGLAGLTAALVGWMALRARPGPTRARSGNQPGAARASSGSGGTAARAAPSASSTAPGRMHMK